MESLISNKEKIFEGARGDGLHLFDRDKSNSIDTEEIVYASGEPKENRISCSTSSSTFLVSTSIPFDTIEQTTNILILNNQSVDQHHWIREHRTSLIILSGMFFLSIIVILTTVFLH